MAVFGVHFVGHVLLPHNAQRGPIDPEADVIGLAADGDVRDGYSAEFVVLAIHVRGQRFVIFVEDYRNPPALRGGPRKGIREDAFELL
jgi:hypothetical protein